VIGRRLGQVGIRAAIQDDTTKIQKPIRKMAPSDELLSGCLRQLKLSEGKERRKKTHHH